MFIAKLSPDASHFVYARVFKGAYATAIQVDAAGNAYVAGSGGPIVGVPVSLQAGTASSSWTSFVMKLDPDGSQVQYAVYIAGIQANGLAIDTLGNAYLAGTAYAPSDFPATQGAFRTSQNCLPLYPGGACTSAFVAKVNDTGTALIYATLLGGSFSEIGASIAVDASGTAYVVGSAYSSDFPVTPKSLQPHRATAVGLPNAFVAKLNPAGTALIYATYLGGTSLDSAYGVAAGPDGAVYVTGSTYSDDFPVTPLAFQSSKSGRQAAFVAKLDSTGQSLVYSTFLGARQGNAIAVDTKGIAHITGSTIDGLPVFRAFQPSFYPALQATFSPSGTTPSGTQYATDAFASAIDATGSALVYSTYLSSPSVDSGLAIALNGSSEVVVVGSGPLSLGAKNALSTGGAAFVVRFNIDGTPPRFTRETITNGANFSSGLVLPGGIASIFCANLTGIAGTTQASGLPLPTELAGVKVFVNGIPAPLFSVSGDDNQQQINLQVPFEATSSRDDELEVEVNQNGLSAWVSGLPIKSTPPGLFTIGGTVGAIQHASDYSPVTAGNPARAGEAIILYGTGLGWAKPSVPSGTMVPQSPVASTTLLPSVTIGGRQATVIFSGLTPGSVGLYQLNVLVPADAAAGNQDVIVSFPSYSQCCIVGGIMLQTVHVDSPPVKISLQ